jgi:tRNA dimethylallyltransferase
MQKKEIKYINIYGPTASGKTDLSIALAQQFNASIINFDSCQFLNYLPALTMCPPFEKNIKMHCFSFLNRDEEFSAGKFITKFQKIINQEDLSSKKILIGGSGFYLFCLLKGISNYQKDLIIQKQIESNSKEVNYNLLKSYYPDCKLHMNNIYRINNYLQYFLQEGRIFNQIDYIPIIHEENILNIFLCPSKDILCDRIKKRTNLYFEKMCQEVREFNENNFFLKNNNIIGYEEITKYLNGIYTEEETKILINLRTRRYAKSQMTFFKKKINTHIYLDTDYSLKDYIQKIMNYISRL